MAGYKENQPAIIFFNRNTLQVAIFDRETKNFITAYKIKEEPALKYLETGKLGSANPNIS